MEQKKSGQGSRRNQYRRELPPIGTKLKATYRGKEYIAEIVSSSADPDRRAILFQGREYRSMTAAAIAITGNPVNGWKNWKF